MANSVIAHEDKILANTKAMIDGLKTVCANAGLANDSSEYKIITEAFLYKFLNDKFLHDLKNTSYFSGVDDVEASYRALDDSDRELACMELSASTAIISEQYLLSTLFNHQNETGENGIAKRFDSALLGIAEDNADIFSVRTGDDQKIKLFNGVTQYIVEVGRRDAFCKSLINKLVDFSFEQAFEFKYDFFSAVFEYLISDYNKDSGTYGEYFTPHSIASIIARILVPDGVQNVSIYDPAAGSGTLVLAAAHEIGESNCTIYTQDRSQKANEFMRLNLVLNNLVHSLPNVVHDDTLLHPRHLSGDKKSIRKFEYIVSNPPFNCDFSEIRNELADEKHKNRFWAGVPNIPKKKPEGMAIYQMFLQHIIFSLAKGGKAAVIVPTSFLTAGGKIPVAIREKIATKKMLRGVISMPSNIFANTGTNVSIIFIDSSREYDSSLLMDASALGEKKRVDGKNQRTFLREEEIERIIRVFNTFEEQDEFSVKAGLEDMRVRKYSFNAGQYFDVKMEYSDLTNEEFSSLVDEQMSVLNQLFEESTSLQAKISEQMKKVRFEQA